MDPIHDANDVIVMSSKKLSGGLSAFCHAGRSESGRNGSGAHSRRVVSCKIGMVRIKQSTTKNESWKPAWKSCWGSQTRMIKAAANSELIKSLGRRSTQLKMITESITVTRIADAGQPVSAT